jgi:hypothetical protein
MSTYKELLEQVQKSILELQKAEVEYSGEKYEVDLAAPYLYACSLVEGIVKGCLEKTPVESIESVGSVAAGLFGLLVSEGQAGMKRNNNNPGGYA